MKYYLINLILFFSISLFSAGSSSNVESGGGLSLVLLLNILIVLLFAAIIIIVVYWNKSLKMQVSKQTAEMEADIVIRTKVEHDLQESERKFRLLFENSPIGMNRVSPDNELLDVNQSYADITGYTQKELLSGAFAEVGYPADLAKSEAEYDKLVAGAASVQLDKRLLKKDGSIIYVSQRVVMVRDDNNVPQFIFGMTVDIGERVKILQKLKDNEEFYRSVLKNMAGIVFNCANDADWTMTYISEGIDNISGYPAEDFINNKVRSYASIIHPEDREGIDRKVQEGINNHTSYTHEYRIIHKNSSIIWVYEEGRGILDERGEFKYLNGTIINITDRKTAEMKLMKYHEELEGMVKTRTEELLEKNRRLEEYNQLFMGREYRIKDLRDEVKELKGRFEEKG